MLTFEMRKDIQCTEEEKRMCLSVIGYITELANKAASHGLLVLENELDYIDDYLLRKGIELITDAVEAQIVKENLSILINSSFKTGGELLKQLIIMDGVLMMQEGYNPRIIKDRLKNYLGVDFIEKLNEEEFEGIDTSSFNEDSGEIDKSFMAFNDVIIKLDGPGLQSLIRNADRYELLTACKQTTVKARTIILSNMSKHSQLRFKEDFIRLGTIESIGYPAVEEAQKNIMKIAVVMEDRGEIILPDKTWREIVDT